MLSTVDNILLDDELLSTTMRHVVMRSQFDPEDTMLFIKNVITHRLPQSAEFLFNDSPCVIDLRPLPSRVLTTVAQIIYSTLRANAPSLSDDNQVQRNYTWVDEALAILLSPGINDACLADVDLIPTMLCYDCTPPDSGSGAFEGTQCSNVLSCVQKFFAPGRLCNPLLFSRILGTSRAWRQHFDPDFRLQGHLSFATYDAYAQAVICDWGVDSLTFTRGVLNSVHELCIRWSAQYSVATTEYDSPQDKRLIEILHAILSLALQSPKARSIFVENFLRWVYDAPWTAVKYLLTSSELLASTFPWMLLSSAYRDLVWEQGAGLTALMLSRTTDRKKSSLKPAKSVKILRTLIFGLVQYLECDLMDTTIQHGIFPAMVGIVITMVLEPAWSDHKRWAGCSPYKDEWTAILFLTTKILAKRSDESADEFLIATLRKSGAQERGNVKENPPRPRFGYASVYQDHCSIQNLVKGLQLEWHRVIEWSSGAYVGNELDKWLNIPGIIRRFDLPFHVDADGSDEGDSDISHVGEAVEERSTSRRRED
ncbi:hypothetical protein EIP86_007461 [Pleurotus ostreatoroseus]|nr:hypothetical protein EIP86_007461 [Pleurotus ostreatoroseus]